MNVNDDEMIINKIPNLMLKNDSNTISIPAKKINVAMPISTPNEAMKKAIIEEIDSSRI